MAVRVSGKCPRCLHQVETDAPRNRVTWKGPCPKEGCGGVILARRARAGEPPPAADKATPPTPTATKKSTVRKVTNATRSAASVPPAPRPGRPAAADPGRRDPDADDIIESSGQPAGPPAAELDRRRPARAAAPDSGDTGRRPYAHLFNW